MLTHTRTAVQRFLWSWRWVGVSVLGFVATIGVVILCLLLYFGNRILPGVEIAGQRLGGLKATDAQIILDKALLNYPEVLTITFEETNYQVPLVDITFTPNTKETARTAAVYGKRLSHVMALLRPSEPTVLPLIFDIDEAKLASHIELIAESVETLPVDPEAQVASEGAILVVQGTRGIEIIRDSLFQTIEQHLAYLDQGSIQLPVTIDDRRISNDHMQDLETRARVLVEKKLILTSDSHAPLTISGVQLAKLVGTADRYSSNYLGSLADYVAESVDSPPRDAVFRFNQETGRVEEFAKEADGHTLQKARLVSSLPDILTRLELEATNSATYALPIALSRPRVQASEVNSLGIHELIGRGESDFKGSIPSRAHNIKLAATRINGAVVPPGETLSFNEIVGEIASATGYQPAYVIQNGKTILGDGGGVCQVSSTVFRAALNAGLPIDERKAHSYRVAYYEQQSHPGLDATIFPPNVDLKITNDSPAHILVQTTLDEKNAHLIVDFYGTSDGRTVEMGNYRLWDVIAPPPDMYVDDPTLPVGQVKQVEHRIAGAKAGFDWKVMRGGEVIQEKTFVSVFRPWQAVYLRGTKI